MRNDHMDTSTEDRPIKIEDDTQDRVARFRKYSVSAQGCQAKNCAELSAALVSPGFSQTVMNNQTKRENIRLSLSVKSLQQDLIQRRLLGSTDSDADSTDNAKQRRMPARLSLAMTHMQHRDTAPRTAPLHGSFRRSSHCDSRTTLHQPQPLLRRDAFQIRRIASNCPPLLPQLPPLQAERLTPPTTAKMLPPLKPLLYSIPPTPSSAASSNQERVRSGRDGGMDALSRAASLKVMKEDYLRACAMSFDSFHGLN